MIKAEQHLRKVGANFWMPFPIIEVCLEKAPKRLLDGLFILFSVQVSSLPVKIELHVEVAVYVLHAWR